MLSSSDFAVMEAVLAAPTPQAVSEAFFACVAPLGATYLQTRLYRRPSTVLTSANHFAAGGFVTRIAPPAWPGSAAFNHICFDQNPLLDAIRSGRTRYRFSEFAPREAPEFGPYWDALSEARIGEALCATSYGADGSIASVHLGFEDPAFPPAPAFSLQMSALVLTERLISFAEPPKQIAPKLTSRERDALAFVADGKSDIEIAMILGISPTTARFHVDNARKKLGAVNRTSAVAKLALSGLL